jgi:hypothetical protein
MTTETKATHTPGPWAWFASDTYGPYGPDGWSLTDHRHRSDEEIVANRLLARAAPDLLAACEAVVAYSNGGKHDSGCYIRVQEPCTCGLDAAAAAIAKARGEVAS